MMRRRRHPGPGDPDLDTERLIRLVKLGRGPKRSWSGGDPTITFAQFVNNGGLCDSKRYLAFEAGYKQLGQTRLASKMGRDELAVLIGHEAVSLIPKLRTKQGLDNYLSEVIAYSNLHGSGPDSRTLKRYVKGAEPQPLTKAQEQRRELGKLRAENEMLRAENSQLQGTRRKPP
jgi:hypothetical protein